METVIRRKYHIPRESKQTGLNAPLPERTMMRPRPRRLLRGSPLARLSSPSSSVTRMAIRVAFVVLIAMAALTLSYQRTMLLRMDDLVVERDRLTVKKSRNEKDVTRRAQEQAKQAVKAVRKAAENTKPTTASSPGAPRKETTAAKQAKPTDKAPRVEATPTDKQPTVLEKAVDGAVPIHQNDGPLVNNITTEGNTTVMDNSTALLGTNITAVPATPLVTANLTSNEAIVVAYAISLIQCGDFQSNIAGKLQMRTDIQRMTKTTQYISSRHVGCGGRPATLDPQALGAQFPVGLQV